MDTLGKKLKALRESKGLSQYEVAEKLEISRGRYNSWENDIAKPRYEMMSKLADFFNVTTDDLSARNVNDDVEMEIRALARNFHGLDENQKDMIQKMVEMFQKENYSKRNKGGE